MFFAFGAGIRKIRGPLVDQMGAASGMKWHLSDAEQRAKCLQKVAELLEDYVLDHPVHQDDSDDESESDGSSDESES